MSVKSHKTWLLLFYILVMIYISLKPGDELMFKKIWKYDKVIHFIEYFFLGFLFLNAMNEKGMNSSSWMITISFILVFPIIDELIQFYTPTRVSDKYDVLADIIGGLFGLYFRNRIYD